MDAEWTELFRFQNTYRATHHMPATLLLRMLDVDPGFNCRFCYSVLGRPSKHSPLRQKLRALMHSPAPPASQMERTLDDCVLDWFWARQPLWQQHGIDTVFVCDNTIHIHVCRPVLVAGLLDDDCQKFNPEVTVSRWYD